jgi:SAM-dependent methyltransferase
MVENGRALATRRSPASVDRYCDYDPFAWLYTNYWGDEFHRQAMPVLERLLLDRVPPRAAILDLCCGDGRITAALARRGYAMTGLDGSEAMLTYARSRMPKIRFLLGDARTFELPPQFDAVISTFDALNHVMSRRELRTVIRRVFACLRPGGWFGFDLNREEAYRDLWVRSANSVDKTAVSIARGSYDPRRRTARCEVTLFRHNGRWERSDFALTQKYHAPADVLESLAAAGFDHVCELDARADLGMAGDIGFGRSFFRAQRP